MKHQNKLTNHHIIPRSRGGDDNIKNIVRIPHKKHDLYHQLFINKTPDEIIDYLNEEFWNNKYSYVKS